MKLKNKVAIVTGAAGGIGRAIAQRYTREGARVVVADIDAEAAEKVAKEIGNGAIALRFDCTSQHSIDELVDSVVKKAGGIDILVNNAGVISIAPLEDVSREEFARVFAVNVEGLLFTLQAVAAQMVRRGRGGKIINMASNASRRGEELAVVYCASKAAVMSITQSAALRLIKERINVNAIAPGEIDTPMWDKIDREFGRYSGLQPGETKRTITQTIPYGRMGKPEDLVGVAVFLASDDSDYVVGQTYDVNGGNCLA